MVTLRARLLRILREILRGLLHHVLVDPLQEGVAVAGDGVPGLVEGVGALVVAVRVGGEGASGHDGDRRHRPRREDHGVRAARPEIVDHFLHCDDRALGGKHRLLLHPDDSLQHHVAGAVGALRVDDRDVGTKRRHGRQLLAGIGAGDRADRRIDLGEVDALIAAEHRKRQVGGAGLVGVRHRRVAVLLELKRLGPAVLHRVAQPMQRPDAGIAAPGKDELLRRPDADQLVVDQVRRHADQRQPLLLLADDLVPRGEGDQMREAFHGDAVAIVHVAPDRLGEGEERGHR